MPWRRPPARAPMPAGQGCTSWFRLLLRRSLASRLDRFGVLDYDLVPSLESVIELTPHCGSLFRQPPGPHRGLDLFKRWDASRGQGIYEYQMPSVPRLDWSLPCTWCELEQRCGERGAESLGHLLRRLVGVKRLEHEPVAHGVVSDLLGLCTSQSSQGVPRILLRPTLSLIKGKIQMTERSTRRLSEALRMALEPRGEFLWARVAQRRHVFRQEVHLLCQPSLHDRVILLEAEGERLA